MSNGGGGRSAGVGVWGFGSMLAITLSWSAHHSILWMIVHGIFSWFYVIYFAWVNELRCQMTTPTEPRRPTGLPIRPRVRCPQ
jgi:hypothetical protein